MDYVLIVCRCIRGRETGIMKGDIFKEMEVSLVASLFWGKRG